MSGLALFVCFVLDKAFFPLINRAALFALHFTYQSSIFCSNFVTVLDAIVSVSAASLGIHLT